MTEKTYTGKEFASVFYLAMAEWHEGGCVGNDPKKQWHELANDTQTGWVGPNKIPSFENDCAYRWKPKPKRMVMIGWYSLDGNWISKTLAAPENVAPEIGNSIYTIYNDGSVGVTPWTAESYMLSMLTAGTVFLAQEDAQAMADWLAVCRNGGAT